MGGNSFPLQRHPPNTDTPSMVYRLQIFHLSWIFALLIWIPSADAASSQVMKIGKNSMSLAISHASSKPWKVRDRVCVIQVRSAIGCGVVTKTATKGAIVKLDNATHDIIAGDRVVPEEREEQPEAKRPTDSEASAPLPRQSKTKEKAPLLETVVPSSESDEGPFNLSLGAVISFSFFYPMANLQLALSPKFAIGLVPMVLVARSGTSDYLALGAYGTLNYYGQQSFRGIWIQLGAGASNTTISSPSGSESAMQLLGLATVGWRGYWDLGLNIGVAVGVQYFQDPGFASATIQSAGILPAFLVDVGMGF